MSKEDGHFGSAELDALHDVQGGTTENGACLTGHLGDFSEFGNKKSCNYRYQAFEQAKANGEIKARLESYNAKLPTANITTSAYDTRAGGKNPSYYCATLPAPQKGDWDVIGPGRDITRETFEDDKLVPGKKRTVTIKKNYNWTQDTWPYWNNAHHLIPKGTLASRIKAEKGQISELIQQGLLKAKYNVNHKVNMLLMPQDREVAEILSLPRHIQLKDDDEPDLKAMCTDHPVYNQMVAEMEGGLSKIVEQYRKDCEQALAKVDKQHPEPDVQLSKDKLEKLSTKLLNIILGWGAGPSLDAFANRALKKQKTS